MCVTGFKSRRKIDRVHPWAVEAYFRKHICAIAYLSELIACINYLSWDNYPQGEVKVVK